MDPYLFRENHQIIVDYGMLANKIGFSLMLMLILSMSNKVSSGIFQYTIQNLENLISVDNPKIGINNSSDQTRFNQRSVKSRK